MLITAELLREKQACEDQVAIFASHWPDGGETTEENLLKAIALGLSIDWLAKNFLTASALAEYERVEASALAEYQRATALFLNMTTLAFSEYKRVEASALAEYQRARTSALAELFKGMQGGE